MCEQVSPHSPAQLVPAIKASLNRIELAVAGSNSIRRVYNAVAQEDSNRAPRL